MVARKEIFEAGRLHLNIDKSQNHHSKMSMIASLPPQLARLLLLTSTKYLEYCKQIKLCALSYPHSLFTFTAITTLFQESRNLLLKLIKASSGFLPKYRSDGLARYSGIWQFTPS